MKLWHKEKTFGNLNKIESSITILRKMIPIWKKDKPELKNSSFSCSSRMLTLPKIGDIKIKMHRPLEGNGKRLVLVRNSAGKWFVSILIDIENNHLNILIVDIDVRILSFAAL
jgi:transposase